MRTVARPTADAHAGVVAGSGSIVRALTYVAVRDSARRIRRLARHPIRLVLLVVVIGGFFVLQVGAIAARSDGPVGSSSGAVAGLATMVCIGVVSAVRRCPIRLRPGDVAWLLPSPRGTRTLLAWHLGSGAARLAVFGTVAGAVAMVRDGGGTLVVFQPAVALTLLALFVRGIAYLAHLLTTRGVPKTLVAAGVVALIAPAALPWLVAARSSTGVAPIAVTQVAAIPGVILDPLLAAIRGPDPSLWPLLGLAALLVAALAVLVVALGQGYQDEAARRAWERASVAAAYQDGSPLAGPIQELVAARLPAGVSSFTRLGGLTGEWALLWRAIANLRRSWRWDLRPTAVMLLVAVGFALFIPELALVPAIALLALALPGFRSGVVGELEHLAIRTIPGAPQAKVRAADVLPVALFAAELTVVALPGLLALGVPIGAIAALLVAAPGFAAASVASASLVSLYIPTLGRRMAFSALLTSLAYTAMVAAGAVALRAGTPSAWFAGAAVLAVGGGWATAAWHLGGRQLGRVASHGSGGAIGGAVGGAVGGAPSGAGAA